METDKMNRESAVRVSQVVWQWRSPVKNSDADRKSRWRRALIQVAVMIGVALFMAFVVRHYWLAGIILVLAAGVLTSFFFIPSVYRVWERIGGALATGVGAGLTWLLLTVFYYLCVVPGRLILLMAGKDPMQRCWERDSASYWSDHKLAGKDSYTRQY